MMNCAVIGCGLLGIKIAGELSLRGINVRMYDSDHTRRDRALANIRADREDLAEQNLVDESITMGKVLVFDRLEDAIRGVQLVSEAIVDDFIIKRILFEELSELCDKDTILTSNTLELNFSKVVENVLNNERTAGLRFLYPVYGINEVELTPTKYTSNEVIVKLQNLLHRMSKTMFLRNGEEALILSNVERSHRNQEFKNQSTKIPFFVSENQPKNDTPCHDSEARMKCVICIQDERNILLSPCNHIALCYACAQSVKRREDPCPICRSPIQSIIRVYHS